MLCIRLYINLKDVNPHASQYKLTVTMNDKNALSNNHEYINSDQINVNKCK